MYTCLDFLHTRETFHCGVKRTCCPQLLRRSSRQLLESDKKALCPKAGRKSELLLPDRELTNNLNSAKTLLDRSLPGKPRLSTARTSLNTHPTARIFHTLCQYYKEGW